MISGRQGNEKFKPIPAAIIDNHCISAAFRHSTMMDHTELLPKTLLTEVPLAEDGIERVKTN
jgi:hypothetical protein